MDEDGGLARSHVDRCLAHADVELAALEVVFHVAVGFRVIQRGESAGIADRVDRHLDAVHLVDRLAVAVLHGNRHLGHVGRAHEGKHLEPVHRKLGTGRSQLQALVHAGLDGDLERGTGAAAGVIDREGQVGLATGSGRGEAEIGQAAGRLRGSPTQRRPDDSLQRSIRPGRRCRDDRAVRHVVAVAEGHLHCDVEMAFRARRWSPSGWP